MTRRAGSGVLLRLTYANNTIFCYLQGLPDSSKKCIPMTMYEIAARYCTTRADVVRKIHTALDRLGQSGFLSKLQGQLLAAVADEYRADLILDLGTGAGNSAAVFSIARPDAAVHTFDLEEGWPEVRRKLAITRDNVTAHVGDLTATDFTPIIGRSGAVVLFWDAHGFDVAAHVLGHIMPLIADRRHIVICHDMSHVHFLPEMDYGGKPFWRGLSHYGSWPGATAMTVLGWTATNVDQIIPILDFCARNQIEFGSFDTDIHLTRSKAEIDALGNQLGILPLPAVHMGYFTMEAAGMRRFPAARHP
jgi:hypothetical protein